MRLPTRLPRPRRRPAFTAGVAALAFLALVAVVLAAGWTPGQPVRSVGATTVGEDFAQLATDPGSAPADGYRPVDAVRRSPTVPAAVLAASVILAGWAIGRRFVTPPRPPVRSWTGGRAGRDRAPPLAAV